MVRCNRAMRLVVLALLLLVVSPVTAPFSTCDLPDLLSHSSAPTPASAGQKSHDDQQALATGPVTASPSLLDLHAAPASASLVPAQLHRGPDAPLRI